MATPMDFNWNPMPFQDSQGSGYQTFFDDTLAGGNWNGAGGLLFDHHKGPLNMGESPMQVLGTQDWNYYQTNIAPIQQDLFKTAMDPNTYTNAANKAAETVQKQFAQEPGNIARTAAGLGVTLTQQQQDDMNQDSALAQANATVTAKNIARETTSAQLSHVIGV